MRKPSPLVRVIRAHLRNRYPVVGYPHPLAALSADDIQEILDIIDEEKPRVMRDSAAHETPRSPEAQKAVEAEAAHLRARQALDDLIGDRPSPPFCPGSGKRPSGPPELRNSAYPLGHGRCRDCGASWPVKRDGKLYRHSL